MLGSSVNAGCVLTGSNARHDSIFGDFSDRFDHDGYGSA